jgi:hypothetical protein
VPSFDERECYGVDLPAPVKANEPAPDAGEKASEKKPTPVAGEEITP